MLENWSLDQFLDFRLKHTYMRLELAHQRLEVLDKFSLASSM